MSNEFERIKRFVAKIFEKNPAPKAQKIAFTCACCQGVFPYDRSEAELDAQTLMVFGKIIPPRERALLCDDCAVMYLAGKIS